MKKVKGTPRQNKSRMDKTGHIKHVQQWGHEACETYRLKAEMWEAIAREKLTAKQIRKARDRWELAHL